MVAVFESQDKKDSILGEKNTNNDVEHVEVQVGSKEER
jgi:hypothetical protein